MSLLFYAATVLLIGILLGMLVREFRRAVLIGITFFSFTILGLPWHVIPQEGVASAIQISFLLLGILIATPRNTTLSLLSAPLNHYSITAIAFWIILVAYLTISKNPTYGISKSLLFFVKIILPVLTLNVLRPFSKSEIQDIVLTTALGASLTFFNMFTHASLDAVRATTGGETNPITVSREIGLGVVILAILAVQTLDQQTSSLSRLTKSALLSVMVALLVFGQLITGSRGPLISSLGAFLIWYLVLQKGVGRKIKLLTLVSIPATVITTIGFFAPNVLLQIPSVQRILNYFILQQFGTNTSDLARITRFESAWNAFVDTHGFGLGTGGFATYYGVEGPEYPHNIILEIAAELGVVGLALLGILLWIIVRRLTWLRHAYTEHTYHQAIGAVCCYSFVNALVSMDISGNYHFFLTGAVLVFITPPPTRTPSRTSASMKVDIPT